MPKANLTQKFAEKAICPIGKSKIQHWDSKTTGFYLEIYETGKASYYYRYKGPNGKLVHHRLGDRQKLKVKAAREAVSLIEGNIAKGIYPETPLEIKKKQAELRKKDVTVIDVYEAEYVHHLKAKVSSYADTNGRFKNHILPALGKKKLLSVKRSEIENFLNEIKKKNNFKNSTLNRMHADVHSFFAYFVDHEDFPLDINPASKIKKYKEDEKEYRELSIHECHALLKACKKSTHPYIYHIVKIWLYTGARRNEVLKAKWDDFNLESRQWFIAHNKQNKMDVKALSDEAISAIKEIPKIPGSDYLFPQAKDISRPIINIYHALKKAKEKAGITKNFTPHDFRHQYATTLVREGVDFVIVKELLGHSRLNTTLRYARVDNKMLLDAANVFGKKYGSTGSEAQDSTLA